MEVLSFWYSVTTHLQNINQNDQEKQNVKTKKCIPCFYRGNPIKKCANF